MQNAVKGATSIKRNALNATEEGVYAIGFVDVVEFNFMDDVCNERMAHYTYALAMFASTATSAGIGLRASAW